LFAHYLSREQIKPFMSKGERISQFVAEMVPEDVDPDQRDIARHPFYRAFFQCWNEKHYYEAHDVLEQLWLEKLQPFGERGDGGARIDRGRTRSTLHRLLNPERERAAR
jgi:hypothetical protein